jgi:hypothetical protein
MAAGMRRGNAEILSAIAAITGESDASVEASFRAAKQAHSDTHRASSQEVQRLVGRIRTRLGMAPAVRRDELLNHLSALDSLSAGGVLDVSRSDLHAWDFLLRSLSARIPMVSREPVRLPLMPVHQSALWTTLVDLDANESSSRSSPSTLHARPRQYRPSPARSPRANPAARRRGRVSEANNRYGLHGGPVLLLHGVL